MPAGKGWVLALTVGLHLLAALYWMGERRLRPAAPPQVLTILLQPRAPRLMAALPTPHRPPLPRTQRSPAAAVVPAMKMPEPESASQPDAAAAAADPSPALLDAANGSGLSLDALARQAGRIDRELRKGSSGVPLTAGTPMARFARAVESAHVEPGLGEQIDSYTYPDGVVVYRKRVAGRAFCRRSGSVRGDFVPGASGLAGVNDAGEVACPAGVAWKRD